MAASSSSRTVMRLPLPSKKPPFREVELCGDAGLMTTNALHDDAKMMQRRRKVESLLFMVLVDNCGRLCWVSLLGVALLDVALLIVHGIIVVELSVLHVSRTSLFIPGGTSRGSRKSRVDRLTTHLFGAPQFMCLNVSN